MNPLDIKVKICYTSFIVDRDGRAEFHPPSWSNRKKNKGRKMNKAYFYWDAVEVKASVSYGNSNNSYDLNITRDDVREMDLDFYLGNPNFAEDFAEDFESVILTDNTFWLEYETRLCKEAFFESIKNDLSESSKKLLNIK